MRLNSAKDLDVYKKSYQLAMKVFEISKSFPAEEKFALTSQMRRSSRSVCLNLCEADPTFFRFQQRLRLHHAGAASRDGVALPAGWQAARQGLRGLRHRPAI